MIGSLLFEDPVDYPEQFRCCGNCGLGSFLPEDQTTIRTDGPEKSGRTGAKKVKKLLEKYNPREAYEILAAQIILANERTQETLPKSPGPERDSKDQDYRDSPARDQNRPLWQGPAA